MSTISSNRLGFTNKLEKQYETKDIKSTKNNPIIDNGTQTDNVLDLSGTKEDIRNEIASQDINSIKAIKIEGKLVSISKEDLQDLITELKTKCLDENNELKSNFKFNVLEKSTGIIMTETNLEASDIREVFNVNSDLDKISMKLNSSESLFNANAEWKDGGSGSTTLHKNKSNSLEKLLGYTDSKNIKHEGIQDISKRLKENASKIEKVEPNNPIVKEMKAQSEVLDELSDLIKLNQEFHSLMASEGNKVPDSKTKEKIIDLRNKIEAKTKSIEEKINNTDIPDNKLKTELKDIVKNSNKSIEIITGTIELTDSNTFINTQTAMGKPTSFISVMDQYKAYKDSYEKTPKTRKGETNDPQGFINMRRNHLRDDKAFAQTFNKLTDKILSEDFNDPTKGGFRNSDEVRKHVEKLFKKENGEFFIKKENVDAVANRYVKLYGIRDMKENAEKIKEEVNNINKALDKNLIEQVMAFEDDIKSLTTNSVAAFGNQVENKMGSLDKKTEKEFIQTLEKVSEVKQDIKERIAYDFNNIATDSQGLIDFLENDLGYGSKTSIFIGVELKAGVSAGISDYEVSLGAHAGGRIELTVEKRFSAANEYRASLNLSAEIGVEAKLFEFLDLSASAEINGSVGFGFDSADEIREFSSMINEFVTEFSKGDKADSDKINQIGLRIADFTKNRFDASAGANAQANVQIGDWISSNTSSSDHIETRGGKTYHTSKRSEDLAPISLIDSDKNNIHTEDGEQAEISVHVTKTASGEVNGDPSKELNQTRLELKIAPEIMKGILSGEIEVSKEVIEGIVDRLIESDPNITNFIDKMENKDIGKDKLIGYVEFLIGKIEHSSAKTKLEHIFKDYEQMSSSYNEFKEQIEKAEKDGLEIPENIKEQLDSMYDMVQSGFSMNLVLDVVETKKGETQLKLGIDAKANTSLNIQVGGKSKEFEEEIGGTKVSASAEASINIVGGMNLDVNMSVGTVELKSKESK